MSAEPRPESSPPDGFLARLVQSLPVVVYCVRLSDYKLEFLGENVRAVFGYDPASLLADPTSHLEQIHPHDRDMVCGQLAPILHGQLAEIEYRLRAAEGTYRTVLHHVRIERDAQGNAIECFGCCLDVTEWRNRELAASRRHDDVESAMRMIAHDLRAPLRAMHGFAQALADDYGPQLGEEGRQFTGYIVEAARQMDQMTIDLLNYTRVGGQDLRISRVDLSRVFKNVLDRLKSRIEAREARVDLPAQLPSVQGNNEILQHVAEQLISNAITFTPPDRPPRVTIRAERRDERWRVWVEDNGIGIAREDHERIFMILERLHGVERYPGNGIGLAIVRRGIRSLGGDCGVESTLDMGSRFWIEVPAAE